MTPFRSGLLGFVFGVGACVFVGFSRVTPLPMLSRVSATIQSAYIEPDLDMRALEIGAIRGYLGCLNDPHTRWIDPETLQKMRHHLKGESEVSTKFDTVDHVTIIGRVGYLRITSFESLTLATEVRTVVRSLIQQGVTGLIIDLRGNGGGLYSSGVKVATLFLSNVPVVHTVDRMGQSRTERAPGNPEFGAIPLVVLVNERSASSSEIFAGAIQDNRRGKIIGHSTYGKATMQKVLPLQDGSAVLYTTGRYLTPLGHDISKKGIAVDVALPKSEEPTGNVAMDPQVRAAQRLLETGT